jgi:glycosyltransferase involved in cell wall biosynthesis
VTTADQPLVSVVLPVMNQAEHIAHVLGLFAAALDRAQIRYEIIPVVNASADNSMAECLRAAASNPAIRPFEEAGGGFGLAIRRGLRESVGDVLCYANSARTSADDLSTSIAFALRNPEYVIKAVRLSYDSVFRRAGSIGFNLLCRSLFNLHCWDMNGTPKVFSRRFDRLMHLTQDDSMIDTEFNAICQLYDYPLLELTLTVTPRHSGKSSTNIRTAIKLYSGAFQFAAIFRKQHADAIARSVQQP